jgi:hypothetical protein
MREFLTTLLQAVITAAVPIVTAFLVKFLTTKTSEASRTAQNATAEKYINEAGDAAATAVLYVSQTYADTLKQSGAFTAENQREAFSKAMTKAKQLLTADAARFLEEAYGDLNAYLTAKIEAEIKARK